MCMTPAASIQSTNLEHVIDTNFAHMTTATLLWGLLFGSIGLGYFLYGKKQARLVPLLCGLALMIYPYFVPNVYVLVLIGTGLVATPYFIRD